MPSEIEAKFRIDELQGPRQRLTELGARRRGRVLETNRYFDWPDRRLRDADSGLRVRVAQPIDAENRPASQPPRVEVTYKGPRQPGPIKIRPETQFAADDAEAPAALLSALGLDTTLTFEKRRETWELDGCLVELDELPHVGVFLEIEGPTEQAVRSVQRRLALSDDDLEQTNYLGMMLAYQRAHCPGQTRVGFDGGR